MDKRRTRDGGFSLIEIMIAMGIIAVALFAVLSMTMHSNTTREDIRELEIAKEAAYRKVDELRGLPWGSAAGVLVPSVVSSYVTAVNRPPEFVPQLRYDVSPSRPVSDGGDPWNTMANTSGMAMTAIFCIVESSSIIPVYRRVRRGRRGGETGESD